MHPSGSSKGSSEDSLYKSAPSNSEDEEDDEDEDGFSDLDEETAVVVPAYMSLKRPRYLSGTSDSSIIGDDESDMVRRLSFTFMESFTSKLNSNICRALNISHSIRRPFSREDDHVMDGAVLGNHNSCRVLVKVLGYEIMEHERKFTVYKLKIEQISHWDRSEIPNWHLFRRYNDFVNLYDKLSRDFPDVAIELPPKRWLGNNFDPVFIGHRIKGLQKFIRQITNEEGVQDSRAVAEFFCLNEPPHNYNNIDSDRVLFDCLGEAVRELRSQIRKKEALADLSDALKETLVQRESEVETLRCETDNLRKQKEALMRAIGTEDYSGTFSSGAYSGPSKPSLMVSAPSISSGSMSRFSPVPSLMNLSARLQGELSGQGLD